MTTNWLEQRIVSGCQVIRTQVEPQSMLAPEVVHYDIPTIQEFGRPSVQPPSEIQSNKFVVRGGDLLVSKLNPRKGCLAIVAADPRPKICSTEFVVLRPRTWDVRFLAYLFESPAIRERVSAVVQSVTRSHQRANPADIYNLATAIPEPLVQRQIADFLDRKTAAIDALIAKKERLLELLAEKRQAVITEAVTKGLDPNVEMKESGVEWIGRVPRHWEVKRIVDLSQVVRGGSPRPAGDPRYFNGDHTPWITVGEVTGATGKFLDEVQTHLTAAGRSLSRFVRPETLLLSNSGATLGVPRITRIGGCINDGVVAFASIGAELERDFLYFYLECMTVVFRDRIKQGSGQPNLNTAIVKATPLPVPPKSEQKAIVQRIDQRLEHAARTQAVVESQLGALREYRQALITAAVTGELDVTNS